MVADASASLSAMDDELGRNAHALRQRLRELIAECLPEDFLGAFTDDPRDLELTQGFCQRLANEGLLALAWPTEYGGGGAGVWLQTVVREEMWAYHEPRGGQYMGLNWVGPAIMRFGTPRQRAYHLPLIAQGQVLWCQGFSEPNAGSDLASLSTTAQQQGDNWRITGQKIWTSYAASADFCMLAARTSWEARRQDGITLFMIPMERSGIVVRPVASMLGPQHLNEVFLSEVPAEAGDVLGEVGEGWSIIRYILGYERVGIARYARCDRLLNVVRAAANGDWASLPQGLRDRFARSAVHNRVARLLSYRVVAAMERETVEDAAAAAARVAMTRGDQETTGILMEIIGEASVVPETARDPLIARAVEDYWRYSQAATVASGAVEIQQLLVARGVLGRNGASNSA